MKTLKNREKKIGLVLSISNDLNIAQSDFDFKQNLMLLSLKNLEKIERAICALQSRQISEFNEKRH